MGKRSIKSWLAGALGYDTQTHTPMKRDSAELEQKPVEVKPLDENGVNLQQTLQLSLNLPKILGKGEDADPLLIKSDSSTGLVGVFDGMGGAGSTIYNVGGETYTGAYIASRLVRDVVAEFFEAYYNTTQEGDASHVRSLLQQRLSEELQQATIKLDAPSSRLKSKLIKQLPTTMAVAYYNRIDTKQYVHVIWAGDSRCYSLDPISGLQQLSLDDLKTQGDALDNLKSDSPMSNSVNADENFHLNLNSLVVDLPIILFAATDGCFGFLYTPTHFEFLLIDTLLEADSIEGWKSLLTTHIQRITGDDASLSLTILGWSSFGQMKIAFINRRECLFREYICPLDEVSEKIRIASSKLEVLEKEQKENEKIREQLREELWLKYKPTYSKSLSSQAAHELIQAGKSTEVEHLRHIPDKLTLQVRNRINPLRTEEK